MVLPENRYFFGGTENNKAIKRYRYIENICRKNIDIKEHIYKEGIDKIVTGKIFAYPLFIAVMICMLWLSFGAAEKVCGVLEIWLNSLINETDIILENLGMGEMIISLITDGIMSGVSSVLSFVPVIMMVFLCLSLLEDSGYMARVSFIMDRLFKNMGMSGRSAVPLILGLGCSVPAIMSCRSIGEGKNETISLIPFINCSAKIPVYIMFANVFFGGKTVWVIFIIYLTSFLIGSAVLIMTDSEVKKTSSFMLEIPEYRIPDIKSTFYLVVEKAWDFISRVFTAVFAASVIIWGLNYFTPSLTAANNAEESLLYYIGNLLAPIMRPLGLGDSRIIVPLLFGLSAKEAVLGGFGVVSGGIMTEEFLKSIFTPISAVSFIVFFMLYSPCVSALWAIKKEKGFMSALKIMIFQTLTAWVLSFIVYNIGGYVINLFT